MSSDIKCPWAFAFGKPGEGVHARRFLGLAYNDVLLTVAAACVTAAVTGTSFWLAALIWLLAGEWLHVFCGVQTSFLSMIGVDACR
jgi:hypothetical protein